MSQGPNTTPIGAITTVKRAVKALLTSPRYLLVLQETAALLGGVTCPVRAFAAAFTSEKGSVQTMPYLEVTGSESDPADEGEQLTGYTHAIEATVWTNGDDPETLSEEIELHVLAMRRFFTANPGDQSLMPHVGANVVVGREMLDPILKMPGATKLVKGGALALTVTTFD